MPTYLYKDLQTGEIYELTQRMTDPAYTQHPDTGAAVKRVLARPGIAFKGSGFYVTDSRRGGEGAGGGGAAPTPPGSGTPSKAGGSNKGGE